MKTFFLNTASFFILALTTLSATQTTKAVEVYKPSIDGYIQNWLLLESNDLDPNLSRDHSAAQAPIFDKEFFTNQFRATPQAGDKVTVGTKELVWKASEFHAGDPSVFFSTEKEDVIQWAITYVISEKEVLNVVLSLGSDDGSCWRVNGVEVFRIYAERPVSQDEDTSRPFTLTKGVNVIMVAVINAQLAAGFSARIIGADKKAVEGLTVSLEPPAKP
jgi:hypothetical protein